MFKKQICDNHFSENIFDKKVHVTKIREHPNYFFRYAKKFGICKTDIGSLMYSSSNSLSNNRYEMCPLVVDQVTSVFTTPDP